MVDFAMPSRTPRPLQELVTELGRSEGIALARVWLLRPGDVCGTCRLAGHCPQRVKCLHLVASGGRSLKPAEPEYDRVDGWFRRFPLHFQKIGRIGATGEPLIISNVEEPGTLDGQRDWLAAEKIQSFFGSPLVCDGEVVGVMAVFSRSTLSPREIDFLRQMASSAAALVVQSDRGDIRLQELSHQNARLRAALRIVNRGSPLVSLSPASRRLAQQIELAARHDGPVLISGPAGSGKSLTARLIHEQSGRRDEPFLSIRARQLAEALRLPILSSPPGASGADSDIRTSPFDIAHSGTLLVEQIDQLPSDVHSSFLDRLSDKWGDRRPRVLASTICDAIPSPDSTASWRDLYYALSIVQIEVPALRERCDDIPPLVATLLAEIATAKGIAVPVVESTTIARLQRHDWPGNGEELRLVLESAVLDRTKPFSLEGLLPSEAGETPFVTAREWKERERENLLSCLKEAGGKVYGRGGAAELMGMQPTSFLYRMKALGIKKPKE